MKKVDFKTRVQIYMYGIHILEAAQLDHILEKLKDQPFSHFPISRTSEDFEKYLQEDLDFLIQQKMIKEYQNNAYTLTKKGRLKLASGGYIGDVKKDKNALFAFRISITAIILAIISFLVSIFR